MKKKKKKILDNMKKNSQSQNDSNDYASVELLLMWNVSVLIVWCKMLALVQRAPPHPTAETLRWSFKASEPSFTTT